jgi:hypothetical protein
MAVTAFQSDILKLLADRRRETGESYVAGGVALNQLLGTPRKSHDIDLFHDTEEALAASWADDRNRLTAHGYDVQILREGMSFVEARVLRDGNHTILQWARDSAFRFFPLLVDDVMGLTLHPFDLATNKILALVGRLEPRDWIDVLNCDQRIQPFGLMVWASCGKDPGFNPRSMLAAASRSHYSQAEIDALDFEGVPPDAGALGSRWHEMLETASRIVALLPPGEVGKCVVTPSHQLFSGSVEALHLAVTENRLVYHEGRIGGAFPSIKS